MDALDWIMVGLALVTAGVGILWHYWVYNKTINDNYDDFAEANARDWVEANWRRKERG